MMRVKDLLKEGKGSFHTLEGEKNVGQAIGLMSGYNLSGLLVTDKDVPKGIFTEQDLLRCHLLFPHQDIHTILVKEVMTSTLIVAEPDETIDDAMGIMIKAGIRHLPVVGQGKIMGMLCLTDLVKAHVGALTQELHYLKDYISDLQDAAHD